MKQVLLTREGVEIRDVPAPGVEPGCLLVQLMQSCISVGTEMSGVRASDAPLWKRALQRPEQVKRLAELAMKEGIGTARAILKNKLSEAHPVGYSASGRVVAVGSGITEFTVGDRVACAGAQNAYHAEIISVPRNLCTAVPEGVVDQDAATVTLGAIALQGIRRTEPSLGETIVVIGLGAIGQLTAQLLKSSGVRVIGIDVDRKRITEAQSLGIDVGLHPDDGDAIAQVQRLTEGNGTDGVIITAASASDDIISTAFRMCRRKARVVLVGDVGLDLKREDVYAKELDLRVSTSYGPGRYDRKYEEEGLDYPIGYVRWTENRNMAEYLRQLADRRVRLADDSKAVYPLMRAADAYRALSDGANRPLFAFLDYGVGDPAALRRQIEHRVAVRHSAKGKIGVALVGAGAFAKTLHLPLLAELKDQFNLHAVVSRRGHEADAIARQYGARVSATDIDAVLGDKDIGAVLIATRHDSHAQLAMKALEQGKHVFVEKPLCLTTAELAEVEALVLRLGDKCPVLMTGFNRRFAPHAVTVKSLLDKRSNPFILNYRVNAGYFSPDHWVHGASGGGRNIGEACHFYDLMGYFAGKPVKTVEARSIAPVTSHYARNDNFVAILSFEDGSVASLTYTALGSADQPKEIIDIYCDGSILQMIDFRELNVFGTNRNQTKNVSRNKGHRAELEAFHRAVRGDSAWPISWPEQKQAMLVAFNVESKLLGRDI